MAGPWKGAPRLPRATPAPPSAKALERGNLVVAEIEAREVGQLDLDEALELTALVAPRDVSRRDAYALRWLQRWLEAKVAGA